MRYRNRRLIGQTMGCAAGQPLPTGGPCRHWPGPADKDNEVKRLTLAPSAAHLAADAPNLHPLRALTRATPRL